ncbi:aldolase/citrate lyase family protein [Rhizobium sp.]|uniref:HpcH/HpaI aldolase family protein n=1 Tax=Rhizobium sp. TaxID=391 RepID=UPI00289EAB7B
MRTNTTRQRALADETAIGTMCNLASPLGAETLGQCGYDFIVLDLQHGENGIDGVQVLMQALSTTPATPLVRVTANSAIQIQRVLDLGAYGVIVPFINNRQEAEEIVKNAFYPPLGSRSWGPTRAMMYAGNDYFAGSSQEIIALPMLESADGLANAKEILEVDGISGCFVGPTDLNISLGHTPDGPLASDTEEGIAEILKITQDLGKIAAIHAISIEDAKKRSEQGFRLITVAADTRLLRLGAQQTLSALRA